MTAPELCVSFTSEEVHALIEAAGTPEYNLPGLTSGAKKLKVAQAERASNLTLSPAPRQFVMGSSAWAERWEQNDSHGYEVTLCTEEGEFAFANIAAPAAQVINPGITLCTVGQVTRMSIQDARKLVLYLAEALEMAGFPLSAPFEPPVVMTPEQILERLWVQR